MMRGPHRRTYRVVLSLVLLFGLSGSAARAQSGRVIERIAAADSLLAEGFNAFNDANWMLAFDHFRTVETSYGRNASSSTARIMAAKSAFRLGNYEETVSLLETFAIDFPGSSYTSNAQALADLAAEARNQATTDVLSIGVILSLSESDRIPSQQLFNGIRMAVDEHNGNPENQPAKMVFVDTGGSAEGAADAVSSLAREGVDLIVGTLYSAEAIAAAERADTERVVFIAPMATDERVSDGRVYAFGANPSMRARGRAMGRFAALGLRMDSLGVITVGDERRVGERLADGFIQGVSEQGASINLIRILSSEADWYELPDTLSADTLDHVQAVYVPMASRTTAEAAGRILATFDRFGKEVRLLGNAAWHDLPQKSHASRYQLTYANDFFPDLTSEAYLQFGWGYYNLSGEDVGRLGVTGFDITRFVLDALGRDDNRTLVDRIRNMAPYEGFGLRIAFNGGNVNEGLFYHRYRDGKLSLIR